jgi:hypothetical protein
MLEASPARSFSWIQSSSSEVRRKTLVTGCAAPARALPLKESLAAWTMRR